MLDLRNGFDIRSRQSNSPVTVVNGPEVDDDKINVLANDLQRQINKINDCIKYLNEKKIPHDKMELSSLDREILFRWFGLTIELEIGNVKKDTKEETYLIIKASTIQKLKEYEDYLNKTIELASRTNLTFITSRKISGIHVSYEGFS